MSKDREKIIEIASKIMIKNLSPSDKNSDITMIYKSRRDEIINAAVDSAMQLVDTVDAKIKG